MAIATVALRPVSGAAEGLQWVDSGVADGPGTPSVLDNPIQ